MLCLIQQDDFPSTQANLLLLFLHKNPKFLSNKHFMHRTHMSTGHRWYYTIPLITDDFSPKAESPPTIVTV